MNSRTGSRGTRTAIGVEGGGARTLARIMAGALTHKDVKNAGRSGDMYENKGSQDIMTEIKSDNVTEIAGILQKNPVCDANLQLLS